MVLKVYWNLFVCVRCNWKQCITCNGNVIILNMWNSKSGVLPGKENCQNSLLLNVTCGLTLSLPFMSNFLTVCHTTVMMEIREFGIGSTNNPLFKLFFILIVRMILYQYCKEKFYLGHMWELKGYLDHDRRLKHLWLIWIWTNSCTLLMAK